MHTQNYSTASPLGITLARRKSRSSKRRSLSNKSLSNAKEPDLMWLSTRSPRARVNSRKYPAVGAGTSRGRRGGCGREEEDGREEVAAAPLEALRLYERFCRSRVSCCVALWRLFALLSRCSVAMFDDCHDGVRCLSDHSVPLGTLEKTLVDNTKLTYL